MTSIRYTTTEQQIQKLKSQNLIIENEKLATDALNTYGYSNLIKSYRDPYIISSEQGKIYRSGVSFEQIYSLYMLDKNLRNAVIAAMLDLEEHLKEQVSDVVANSFGTHQDNYLKYRNYRNKKKRLERFSLKGILESMNNTLKTDKDPIHHYKEKHGIVPPWILFKSVYFSTIINYVDQLKDSEQEKLVHRLYNTKILNISEDTLKLLMMDSLFLALDYRNLAAHGGRMYNFNSKKRWRLPEIDDRFSNTDLGGFSQLMFALNLFAYSAPLDHIEHVLTVQLNRHCNAFPQDVTYLGQVLHMDIVHQDTVFITNGSSKYHTNPHCSGIKNAQRVDREVAISNGYKPCKRCAN